jgi:hypothetical protein
MRPVSHFAAIGLGSETPDEFERSVGRVMDAARPPAELGAAGQGHLWWADASGAAVAAHLASDQAIECVTPFFLGPEGGTRWRVRSREPHLDAGCGHCSGADCDVIDGAGDLVTRTTVQWAFFRPYRSWLARPREYDLQIVAFASELSLCESSADLDRVQAARFGEAEAGQPQEPGKPFRLAEEAFLPYGMFGNEGNVTQRARATLTGRVEAITTRTNTLTGRPFLHARLVTLGGPIDVVASLAASDGDATKAQIALVDAWLVGRPCEPPPMPEPRGWLTRLLRS